MIDIGIVGGGFVGKATAQFGHSETRVWIYDLNPDLRRPSASTSMEDIYRCDVVFVCVPTPMLPNGSCHTAIVESVVKDLQLHDVHHIVIRSTVPIGFSQSLAVNFMPEFLTEKNWAFDFANCKCWVVGIDEGRVEKERHSSFKSIIETMIETSFHKDQIVSSKIEFVSTKEAEFVKYIRNCFLATKIGFFNEMYGLCRTMGMDYDIVRRIATEEDARIGGAHSNVPGHDGKFGFGGTCLPKDLASLVFQFQSKDVACPILTSVHERNITLDRPDQDWCHDHGRAFLNV